MRDVRRRGESTHGAGCHKSRAAESETSSVHLTEQEHRGSAQGSRATLWPHGPTVSATGFIFLCFRAGACPCHPQICLKYRGCSLGNTQTLLHPGLGTGDPEVACPFAERTPQPWPCQPSEGLWKTSSSSVTGTPRKLMSFFPF